MTALAVTSLVLAVAASSGARGYNVWSCTLQSTPYAQLAYGSWFAQGSGARLNHCPDGLEIQSGDLLDSMGSNTEWQWEDGSGGSELVKVTLTMKGGDTTGGLAYELATEPGGPAVAQLPDRQPGDDDETVTVALPAGAPGLVIRGVCTLDTCTGSTPLLVNDIKIRLDDSDPPETSLATDRSLNFDASAKTTGDVPWFRPGTVRVVAAANDPASGVGAASLTLDDDPNSLWTPDTHCAADMELLQNDPPAIVYDAARVCDAREGGALGIDLSGQADGRHKLTLNAVDAIGNAATPLAGWLGIDGTPPAAPATLDVGSNNMGEGGWTSSPVYSAISAPAPSQGPNASPIADVQGAITRDDKPGPRLPVNLYGYANSFPSEGHFQVESWYLDSAGNRGYSRSVGIGYDTTAPPAPVLHENGWISRDQLIAGYKQSWDHLTAPADVESGICGFEAVFDKSPVNTLSNGANVHGNVDGAQVPAAQAEGLGFSHVASVSCAGAESNTSTVPMNIDAGRPRVGVRGLGSGEWSRTSKLLQLDPTDDLSGVLGLHWKVDNGAPQSAAGATSISIGEGEHTLTTWAEDNAHNVSDPVANVVRVDETAPSSWLGPAGPGDPNHFVAHVQDSVSGLDSAELEYRRADSAASADEQQWRQMGSAFLPDGDATAAQSFTRELDDSALADGRYELRVIAVDRAGNVGAGSTLPAGGAVTVEVPLRVRPTLTLAVADLVRRCVAKVSRGCPSTEHCRSSAKCSMQWVATRRGAGLDRIVDWGDRTALTGQLLTPGGAPVAGGPLTIYATPRGGSRELAGHVTTGADGRFEWRLGKGPSRVFEAVSTATSALASARTTATEAVRAGVSLKISDRSVHSGQIVTFSGRLASGGLGVPAGGKKISIEYWNGDKWAPAIDAPFTDGSGRFRAPWPVKPVSAAGTLFFRAKADSLPTEPNWPFESGKSKTIRVFERP